MWTPRHLCLLMLGLTAPAVVPAQGHAGHPAAPATSAVARPSDADVAFIRGMIAHHAQAVEMVALVPQRTSRREFLLIAERIDVSQRDEMAWMRGWLAEHGFSVADTSDAHAAMDHASMDHGAMGHETVGHGAMPGMLSAEEMAALRGASGLAFERRFLEGMIKHHAGALTMVATLFATAGAAQRSEIFGFASDVDVDQRAEIARMRTVLAALPRP